MLRVQRWRHRMTAQMQLQLLRNLPSLRLKHHPLQFRPRRSRSRRRLGSSTRPRRDVQTCTCIRGEHKSAFVFFELSCRSRAYPMKETSSVTMEMMTIPAATGRVGSEVLPQLTAERQRPPTMALTVDHPIQAMQLRRAGMRTV